MKKKTGYKKKFRVHSQVILIVCFFAIVAGLSLYKLVQNSQTNKILTIHNPKNETYSQYNIVLNVSSSVLVSEISRSIDNSAYATECFNCTGFTRYNLVFADGEHNIKVYAKDLQGNLVSDEIEFTIKK